MRLSTFSTLAPKKRILIIRFSSIGDIVLTTPVVRAMKEQMNNVEIHFLTRKVFAPVLENNPYIDHLHTVDKEIEPIIDDMRRLNFTMVVDLHKNRRSRSLAAKLGVTTYTFPKYNVDKWLLVNFKWDRMPDLHIVDRYYQAVEPLRVKPDGKGLDYFLSEQDAVPKNALPETHADGYLAWVVGAAHATKAMPVEKSVAILKEVKRPVVLLGGKNDREKGGAIADQAGRHVYNACGEFALNQSAWLVKNADRIITPDTGLMHIASAFNQKIMTLWGNTVPQFGMYPFLPEGDYESMQVEGLKCRPCSKIGYDRCPKKHFRCMEDQDAKRIVEFANG